MIDVLQTLSLPPLRIWLTVFLFVCRALIAGSFQALYVYTPEVYPTRVRALGVGVSSTIGRIGGIISPYIAQVCGETMHAIPPHVHCLSTLFPTTLLLQVLFPASDIAGITVFMVIPFIAAVAVFILPIETRGRKLKVRQCISHAYLHSPLHAHTDPDTHSPTYCLRNPYSDGCGTVVALALYVLVTNRCNVSSGS